VILFNKTMSPLKITLKQTDLNMHGKLTVRDLWQHVNKGSLKKYFSAEVAPHGVVMLKISQGE
jgi:alpha-galactosidase